MSAWYSGANTANSRVRSMAATCTTSAPGGSSAVSCAASANEGCGPGDNSEPGTMCSRSIVT